MTYVPLGEFIAQMEANRVYRGFMEILTIHQTRRIVQVSTRKYRTRKKRH